MKHRTRQIARLVTLLAVLAAVISWAPAGAAAARQVTAGPAHRAAWHARAPLPVAQGGLATATIGGRILAIGGFSSNFKAALHTVQAYSPRTNRWQALAPMPTARGDLRVTVSRGRIYAIGGAGSNGTPVAAVEVYHPAANRWAKARPLSVAREGAGVATTADGRIVVIGGCCTAAHRLYRIAEIYQPRANRWRPFPGLPVARAGLVAAPGTCGLIYAIAGFQGEPPNTPASHFLDAIRME